MRHLLAALCLCAPAHAAGVVSLNLCTDQLLVLLAPDRIAALSPLARDAALSVVAAQAAQLPWVRPDAEAVLRLHPDLVLAGEYGAQTVLAVLRNHGVPVAQFGEAQDFPAVAAEINKLAITLNVPARGARLAAATQSELAAIKPTPHGTALLWQARGYSAGRGSFGDAVLRQAGYRNVGTGGEIGLEALVTHPPGLLVTETAPRYPSLSTDMLWHPALRGLARKTIAPALLACAGPWSVAAVRSLAQ